MNNKKKPLTYCERYGHIWVLGTAPGFLACSHTSHGKSGMPIACPAVKREGQADVVHPSSPNKQQSTHQAVQQPLWGG